MLRHPGGARESAWRAVPAREAKRERGACVDDAGHGQLATHPASEVAADGQAQTDAVTGARVIRVDLHERLEDGLELVPRDPNARIGHAHTHVARADGYAHAHQPASIRELDRVREQVEQ